MILGATVFVMVVVVQFSALSSAFVVRIDVSGDRFRTDSRYPSYVPDAGGPGVRSASSSPDGHRRGNMRKMEPADAGSVPKIGSNEFGRELSDSSPSPVGKRWRGRRGRFHAGPRSTFNAADVTGATDAGGPGVRSASPSPDGHRRGNMRKMELAHAGSVYAGMPAIGSDEFGRESSGSSLSPFGKIWRGRRGPHAGSRSTFDVPDAGGPGERPTLRSPAGSRRPADVHFRTGPPPTKTPDVKTTDAGDWSASSVHSTLKTVYKKWTGFEQKETILYLIIVVAMFILIVLIFWPRVDQREPLLPFVSRSTMNERERKWKRMIDNWDEEIKNNFKEVRKSCQEGIPPLVRPKAWFYLSKAHKLQAKHESRFIRFYKLLERPGEKKWIDLIKTDLPRTFPEHNMFKNPEGPGQKELFDVLKAYTILKPENGYWQTQAPIAAFLLTQMQTEQAFWCFVAICDDYLKHFTATGTDIVVRDGNMLLELLKVHEPDIYKLFKKQEIDPTIIIMEWFSCGFARTLSWPLLFRMWDIFLIDGIQTFFKMALIYIKVSLPENSYSDLVKRFPTMNDTIQATKYPPFLVGDEDRIINKLIKLHISEDKKKKILSIRKSKGKHTKILPFTGF